MELIEVILSKENLNRAYKKVVANKGAGGVDVERHFLVGGRKIFCVYGKNSSLIRNRYV